MNHDNFVSFAIVNGFFFGLVVAVLKYDSAEMITIFTFFVTIGFYLIMLLGASFYIRFFDFKRATIHKKRYDGMLEFYMQEFEKREKIGDKIREFMRSLEAEALEDETRRRPRKKQVEE